MSFFRSIPAYVWVGLLYFAFIILIEQRWEPAQAGETFQNWHIEQVMSHPGYNPFGSEFGYIGGFSDNRFWFTWNAFFIFATFIAMWVEVLRATNIRDRSGNDTLSLLAMLAAVALFLGVDRFGTTAFGAITLTAIGDMLLDRRVGQAVARRDFTGLGGG